jgi:hypothetical protein
MSHLCRLQGQTDRQTDRRRYETAGNYNKYDYRNRIETSKQDYPYGLWRKYFNRFFAESLTSCSFTRKKGGRDGGGRNSSSAPVKRRTSVTFTSPLHFSHSKSKQSLNICVL